MINLKAFNTFGLDVTCQELIKIQDERQLISTLKNYVERIFILGGGSNILLLEDLKIPVLKNEISGLRIIRETGAFAIVEVGAGMNWHEFVLWTLRNKLYGLENLSFIPGTVGASPMQNIGAYGVEVKDFIDNVQAIKIDNAEKVKFSVRDCAFGYRSSVFKNKYKDQFFISKVTFKLHKTPMIKLSYGNIKVELEKLGFDQPTPKQISNVIIKIRKSKLPDPLKLGNAGSFFKNPIVSDDTVDDLQAIYPRMPIYPWSKEHKKLSAGWLIERSGMKGYKHKGAACYSGHALILINQKNAKPVDIVNLADLVIHSVKSKFGIVLSPEVNYVKN